MYVHCTSCLHSFVYSLVFTHNHETSHARPLQRPPMDYSCLGPYSSFLPLSIHLFPYFVPLRPLFRELRPVLLSLASCPPILASWDSCPPLIALHPFSLRRILRFLHCFPTPCVLSSTSCALFSGPCNLSSTPLAFFPALLTSFPPLCPSLLAFCPPLLASFPPLPLLLAFCPPPLALCLLLLALCPTLLASCPPLFAFCPQLLALCLSFLGFFPPFLALCLSLLVLCLPFLGFFPPFLALCLSLYVLCLPFLGFCPQLLAICPPLLASFPPLTSLLAFCPPPLASFPPFPSLCPSLLAACPLLPLRPVLRSLRPPSALALCLSLLSLCLLASCPPLFAFCPQLLALCLSLLPSFSCIPSYYVHVSPISSLLYLYLYLLLPFLSQSPILVFVLPFIIQSPPSFVTHPRYLSPNLLFLSSILSPYFPLTHPPTCASSPGFYCLPSTYSCLPSYCFIVSIPPILISHALIMSLTLSSFLPSSHFCISSPLLPLPFRPFPSFSHNSCLQFLPSHILESLLRCFALVIPILVSLIPHSKAESVHFPLRWRFNLLYAWGGVKREPRKKLSALNPSSFKV